MCDDCAFNQKSFIDAVSCCILDSDVSIYKFLNTLNLNILDYIGILLLKYNEKEEPINLTPHLSKLWLPVFHKERGLCFSLNLNLIEEPMFMNSSLDNLLMSSPRLMFSFSSNLQWVGAVIMVHNEDDLSLSEKINPVAYLEVADYNFDGPEFTYLHISLHKKGVFKCQCTRIVNFAHLN